MTDLFALLGLPPRNGATQAEIEAAERKLGELPDDYRGFLRQSDGIEGFVGNGYVMLYQAKQVADMNPYYPDDLAPPGLTVIGSNSGGDGFGFMAENERIVYVQFAFIGMDETIEPIGETFVEFVQHLRALP